ncbi:MAG TPA: AAA family ATPase [Candidatus Woesebacteria bacterium]|nr:AAA family ATPase [Candidatus Woesebacteria bacterium]
MNKIFCVTGLTGSGKSVVGEYLKTKNFLYLRFGQLTIDELEKRGLEVNEVNERMVREELREKHGMAAYATLNLAKFDELIKMGNVIGDGLYSWEEYKIMKEHFGEKLVVVAVYASPKLRYLRLKTRKERPLTEDEARSRDYSELEILNKGGTIAMADHTIVNSQDQNYLLKQIDDILTTELG